MTSHVTVTSQTPPFSENMASLKELLEFSRESKHERKVNFYFVKFLPGLSYDILKPLGMFMCPFKIKFISISTLTFKDEESGKNECQRCTCLKSE